MQVIVVGEDELAKQLYETAAAPFAFGKTVLRLTPNEATPQNLPPALAETIPNLPEGLDTSVALVCSGFSCFPPVNDPESLANLLRSCLSIPGRGSAAD